jgi:hypothetical protein
MAKLLSVVFAILFAVTGAYSANPKANQITAGASGSVQLNQISYAPGNSVQIDYSYAGLPLKTDDTLVLQTLCLGAWNGVVFDTSTEFFQSDKIVYSSSSGSGVDMVTIPDSYQGSGSCTVSFYLLFTVNNTRFSKTLATSTFTVAVP